MKTLEELNNRLLEIDEQVEKLKGEKAQVKREIIERFCAFKIGQKAIYERVMSINRGTFWRPIYETKQRTETLVCVSISYDDYFYCKFKRLKKDGTLTDNFVDVREREVKWIDEYIDIKQL